MNFFYGFSAQALASGLGFSLLVYFARYADSTVFAVISFYLLVVNCGFSVANSWVSQEIRYSTDSRRINLLPAVILGLITGSLVIFCPGGSSFGWLIFFVFGGFVYCIYGIVRRHFFFEKRYDVVFLSELMRFLLALIVYAFVNYLGYYNLGFFYVYLLPFVGALAIFIFFKGSFFIVWRGGAIHGAAYIGASAVNVLTSQLGSILAAGTLLPFDYSVLRAHEILLFPVFFTIVAIEPFAQRLLLSKAEEVRRQAAIYFALIFFVVFSPVFVFFLTLNYLPVFFVNLIVPDKYFGSGSYFWYYFLISLFVCIGASLKILIGSIATSVWSFRYSLFGFFFIVVLFVFFNNKVDSVLAIVFIKLVYEAFSCVAGFVDLKLRIKDSP